MLYNFNDNRSSRIIKLLVFWLSLGAMFLLFAVLLRNEIKPIQKASSIEIDIKNKINICLPEEGEIKKL